MHNHSHTHMQPGLSYRTEPDAINCNFNSVSSVIGQLSDIKADKAYVDNVVSNVNNIEVNISCLYQEINELKERGEKEMIESIKIIQIYKDNRKASIDKEYNAKFTELKEKNEMMSEYKALVNSFEASLMELYTSQFDEGQTETNISRNLLAIVDNGNYAYKYAINDSYYPEEAKALEDEKQEEIDKLTQLCAEVSTLLGICKTKEEVEDVLVNYGIMDKKTHKLNMLEV